MRVLILPLVAIVMLCSPAQSVASWTLASNAVAAATSNQDSVQQPGKDFKIDIDINRTDRGWYANPIWIAIGAIALILFVALIVLASRGGGTTIVKER